VPAAAVTDSAGMRLLTYDLGAVDAPVFAVLGDPEMEIGVVDGPSEYSFSRIVDLAVLADGSLVVTDGSMQQISIFDRDGRYAGSLGQRGEGPGEFLAAPALAGVADDTLFAYDTRSGRMTSFTRDGQLVESTALRSGGGNRISELGRASDGNYLAVSRWTPPSSRAEVHDIRLELDSIVIERVDPRGEIVDTLRVMPDRRRARMIQDRGDGRIGVIQAEPPHSARAFVESNESNVIVAWSDSFVLDMLPDADAMVRVRVLGIDHPADAEQIRTQEERAYRQRTGNQTIDAQTRMLFDFLPDRLPAFTDVTLSRSGDVWVARPELDDANGREWLVFARTGDLKGSVRTPPRMRLLAVEPTNVIGVVTDDLDVPFIRRYPLLAPSER